MFSKILIANRGEIALRIIKTCKRLGVKTVAIYSDADAEALHVREADEAVAIGGVVPRESYLVMEKVLQAARATGAEAIHPGYGFLSENAEFARLTSAEGMTFIGPSAHAIETLGDKTAARAIASKANVPYAPGSQGAIDSLDEARSYAGDIGFPVLLKAAAGGGGKGMRIVRTAEDLESAFNGARGEALNAFGDDRVFIEKYIVDPKHIEIQVLADQHGTTLHFPERECSVQRRHQKVIEESPSAAVSPEIRREMRAAAARLAEMAEYTNAGTVEFLLDSDGKFYFMEVNTRLQVEHPVTEMVSGVDLVEQQLLVASGAKTKLRQEDLEPNGHAIECRICVEDVYNDFLPDTGTVTFLDEPQGEFIRNDSALYVGFESGVYYDSMVAKLIVWGATRVEAIERAKAALDRYHVAGIKTTTPFCRAVFDAPAFQDATYSTHFVGAFWENNVPDDLRAVLAAGGAYARHSLEQRRKPQFSNYSRWKNQRGIL